MSALTFKVGGDTSGLSSALSKGKGLMRSFATAGKKLLKVSVAGGLAGGLVAITASAVGLKKALDLGGRLSDVASNTGLLAGEALILERALQDSGIEGSKLQGVINKMQKSIVEAEDGVITYRKAFDGLGLSVEDLAAMKPGEQFQAILAAMNGIADPAERSARAMQIFGRMGGSLGAMAGNADAIKNAMTSVGGQADMLNRSADKFDRSADIIGGLKGKLSAFFVGFADKINPVLLPLLEEVNKLDLSGYGAKVGEAVAFVAEAFAQDKFGTLVSESLMYGAKRMINFLARGFLALGAAMAEAVKAIPEMFASQIAVLTSGEFWKGVGKTALGGVGGGLFKDKTVGTMLASPIPGLGLINSMIPDDVRGRLAGVSGSVGSEGMNEVVEAYKPYIATLEDVSGRMSDAFREVAESPGLLEESTNAAAISKILHELRGSISERESTAEAVAGAVEGALSGIPAIKKSGAPEAVKPSGGLFEGLKPVVSSLARVGGARLARTSRDRLDEDRNKLLRQIARNTSEAANSVVTAVFA